MIGRVLFLVLLVAKATFSQFSLDHFIGKAVENSPTLKELANLRSINRLQHKLNRAQNSAFQISLTGDYLFAPYFNNHGDLITTDPSPEAIGYDINLTDGGLYSAKINLERNILNGKLTGALEDQIRIQDENYQYSYDLEKHNLGKQVVDQYLNALQLQWLIDLSKENVSNLREQVKLTSGLVEKGYLKAQDYLLLKIEFNNQSIALDDATQQYQSSLFQLYALCGMPDTSVAAIEPVTLRMGSPKIQSGFTRKYQLDSLTTVNGQQLFETRYWPQVKLFFNTGLEAVELSQIRRKFGMNAGLNISLPLFDGNQKSLTRQQNLLARRTIQESRSYSERTIGIQRKNFQSRIQSLQKSIIGLTEQVNDYKKLIEITSRQLQQGNVSMIDYLTLLRNYVDLRKNKIGLEINFQLEISNLNYWSW